MKMKLSSILLIQIICLVWDSISTGFIADKNRRAVTDLNFEIEGCRREGGCVLKEATLKVYFKVKTCQRTVKILLQITHDKSSAHYPVTLSNSGWHDFDVKNVMSWLSSTTISKRLSIKCQGCKGKVKPVLRSVVRKPKLVWRVEQAAAVSKTIKRRFYCSQAETKCCLHRKVVDVDEFHWKGWILIPFRKRLTVNQCSGVCDLDQVHSAYAQLLAQMQPEPRIPCCVPTKLSSVSVFVKTEGGIELKELDLVAEECGCA